MTDFGEHPAWRTAFARRYIEPYREHPAAVMAVLGGSVAQGVADRWSSIVLFWSLPAEPCAEPPW